MQRDELLGYYILTRGWTTREIVAQAFDWRRQKSSPGEDLASLLLASGILTAAQAQEARAEVASALQDQLPTVPIRSASQQVQAHIEEQQRKKQERPEAGETLGHYEILGALSEGNMGYVLRAQDQRSGALAAIKFVSPKAAGQIENARFEREVKVLSALNHPNIVKVKGSGLWSDRPYLVMELIQGESYESQLNSHLRLHSSPPELSETLPKLADMAQALRCIHEQEIIHRDFKPQNIVIEASSGRAVLIDFGLIRANTDSQNLAGLTQTHEILGTPAYMSPEQFMPGGRYGDVSAASDVWAFGASAWLALTGSSPFARGGLVETLEAVLYHDLPLLHELNPKVPRALAELLTRCLRREPDERPSAAELCEALQGHASLSPPPATTRRRSRLLVAGLMALSVLVPATALAIYQVFPAQDLLPPKIQMDGSLVEGRYVDIDELCGQLTDDVGASLKVDGAPVPVDPDGRFRIPVRSGLIELLAEDKSGKRCELSVRVFNSKQWGAMIHSALSSLKAWQDLSPEVRRAVIDGLLRRLGGEWTLLPELSSESESKAAEPLRLSYRGINFRLIPGGRLRVGLLTGPPLLQLEYRMLLAFLDQKSITPDEMKWLMRERSKRENLPPGQKLMMPFPPGAQLDDPDLIYKVCKLRFGEIAKEVQRKDLELPIEPFLLAENELNQALWNPQCDPDTKTIPATGMTALAAHDWLKNQGLRLPDRAEWQFAARGGSSEALFWGTNVSDGRWVHRGPSPLPNDERRRNGYGLVDMIGNAREWAVPIRRSRVLETGLRREPSPLLNSVEEEMILMSPPGIFPLWAACPYIFEYAAAGSRWDDVGLRPAFSLPPL